MAGFLSPSVGTVELDGRQIWRNHDVYREIGLVPEREALFDYLSGRPSSGPTPTCTGCPTRGRRPSGRWPWSR